MVNLTGITLKGVFTKASTTIDGGWNVTFSVNQDEADQIIRLNEHRDELMQIACVPIEGLDLEDLDG